MEEIGIPELTLKQLEELCEIAEEAAREYVLSRVPSRTISTLTVAVDAEGTKPITVDVDVEIALSHSMKSASAEELADEAKERAFATIERYLRKI